MAAGFDPNIILQGMRQGPSALETMRSLQDLTQDRQRHETSLASLLQKQGQESALRDIYRTHGADPNALMAQGFGPEAMDVQKHLSEVGTRNAQAKKSDVDAMRARMETLAQPLYGLKDQAGLDNAFAFWRQSGASEQDLSWLPRQYNEQTAPFFQQLASTVVPAEKRAQMEHQGASLEETKRHNRAMEGRPSGVPALIIGEGGAQYFAQPGAPAAPITDAQGRPIAKPQTKQPRPLTKGDRDALATSFDEQANLDSLLGRFKDGYAGKGAMGATSVGLNKKLGSWAPEDAQQEANFWADFQGTFDLARRNKLFGASLTPGESAAWEGAKTITPNSKPEVVKKALARLRDAARESAKRRGRSLAKDGYTAGAIEEYTGPLGVESSGAGAATGALSADERAEMEQLRKELGR